jgi:hypothetical protein
MKYHKPLSVHYKPLEENDPRQSLSEAIMYCTFLEFCGMKGWRIPTESEVDDIRNYREFHKTNSFIYKSQYVWTQADLDDPNALNVHNRARVLAVRTIKND